MRSGTLCCSAPVRVDRVHRIEVPIDGAAEQQLAAYLAKPERPLKALLNRRKVEVAPDGRFLYASRPYDLLTFQIRPEVSFRAVWDLPAMALTIGFEDCDPWPRSSMTQIAFSCDARIRPRQGQLLAEADLALETVGSSPLLLPERLLKSMGEQALGLVVALLEKRCRQGLKHGAQRWLANHPDAAVPRNGQDWLTSSCDKTCLLLGLTSDIRCSRNSKYQW